MSDDIGGMTAELAADPSSLIFMALADALRRKGQLRAALSVAERGLGKYPAIADAHDLVARIRADLGEGDRAFDAWTDALRLAPDHLGAHKGLAFLAYRAGDFARSQRHLECALALAPDDATLAGTAARLRARLHAVSVGGRGVESASDVLPRRGSGRHAVSTTPSPVPPAMTDQATLLFDQQGRVLRGDVTRPDGTDAGESVAAALAGVTRDAERTIRLLGLGEWRAIAVEGGPVNYEIRSPTEATLLLVMRGREVPAGRLSRLADRAMDEARVWLEVLA